MWIVTTILTLAFVASAAAFGVLLGKYRNLKEDSQSKFERFQENEQHWFTRYTETLDELEQSQKLRERDQSQIKILNGMVDRRNQRVDYYKRELDKCKLEHSNMTKMLTVAINEVNPLTRKKALRGF